MLWRNRPIWLSQCSSQFLSSFIHLYYALFIMPDVTPKILCFIFITANICICSVSQPALRNKCCFKLSLKLLCHIWIFWDFFKSLNTKSHILSAKFSWSYYFFPSFLSFTFFKLLISPSNLLIFPCKWISILTIVAFLIQQEH